LPLFSKTAGEGGEGAVAIHIRRGRVSRLFAKVTGDKQKINALSPGSGLGRRRGGEVRAGCRGTPPFHKELFQGQWNARRNIPDRANEWNQGKNFLFTNDSF